MKGSTLAPAFWAWHGAHHLLILCNFSSHALSYFSVYDAYVPTFACSGSAPPLSPPPPPPLLLLPACPCAAARTCAAHPFRCCRRCRGVSKGGNLSLGCEPSLAAILAKSRGASTAGTGSGDADCQGLNSPLPSLPPLVPCLNITLPKGAAAPGAAAAAAAPTTAGSSPFTVEHSTPDVRPDEAAAAQGPALPPSALEAANRTLDPHLASPEPAFQATSPDPASQVSPGSILVSPLSSQVEWERTSGLPAAAAAAACHALQPPAPAAPRPPVWRGRAPTAAAQPPQPLVYVPALPGPGPHPLRLGKDSYLLEGERATGEEGDEGYASSEGEVRRARGGRGD